MKDPLLTTAITLTIHATVVGTTTTYIGATEAGGFWAEDLSDLGINTYRLWTKMAELEWWDDDDAMDGQWDDSENGIPTIAEIKADAGSGFTNTVPWAWWDERFDEVQSWRYGLQTRREIVEALVQDGITPVVTLRTYDDQGQPEQRPSAQWAPRPPVDENFRNEWWEHCFAIAYWLNVRNDYGITHFEVLNEPDWAGQGWLEYGGTITDYVDLVLYAHDAISYANSFADLPAYIHAPVVAVYNSPYVASTLDQADAAVQVVDYHTYASDVRPSIISIRNTISSHNPDGVLEPIWNSEWGALWSSYDTFDRAMLTANQLLTFSEEQVEGVTVFNMYDWTTTPGQDYGLIDLQDDGQGGALRFPTESYYAFRLMARGLIGAKARLAFTPAGLGADTRVMITRDEADLHVILLQNDVGAPVSATVNISELVIGSGRATLYEYSVDHRDEVVAFPTVTAGLLTFTAPANGVSLVVIPLPDLSPSNKATDPAMAAPGEPITYTLVLSNATAVGPASARLTDTLPAGVAWAGRLTATSGATGYADGVVTWTGAISPAIPVTVTFAVTTSWQPAGTVLTNGAVLTGGLSWHLLGPVTTTVVALPGVLVSPSAQGGSGPPGVTVTYALTLSNTGNLSDGFSLTVSSTWPAGLVPTSLTLPMGGSAPLTLTVSIPPGTPAGTADQALITATSQTDPLARHTAHVTTTAEGIPAVVLSPLAQEGTGSPGMTVTYALTATNAGNQDDTFSLWALATWPVGLVPTSTNLPVGGSASLTLTVSIPPGTPAGTVDRAQIKAISWADPVVSATAFATTTAEATPGVTLFPPAQEGTGQPGSAVTYILTLTNTGNLGDSFSLAVSSTWPAGLVPTSLTLPMGGSAPLTLTVFIPPGTPAGTADRAQITATSHANPIIRATAYVTTTLPHTWTIYLPLVLRLEALTPGEPLATHAQKVATLSRTAWTHPGATKRGVYTQRDNRA